MDDLERLRAPMREIEQLDVVYCALVERGDDDDAWDSNEHVQAQGRLAGQIAGTAWSAHAACCRSMQTTRNIARRRSYGRLAEDYLGVVNHFAIALADPSAEEIADLRVALATARKRNDGSSAAMHEHFKAAWTLRAVLDRFLQLGDLDGELSAVEALMTS